MTRFDDDDDSDGRKALRAPANHDDQDFKELIAMAADAGIPVEDMIGGQTQSTKESFGIPLLFTFEDDKRRVTYRRSDGMAHLFSGDMPAEAAWIEADVRMTLKKALRRHGTDLLAFERLHRVTSIDVTGMTVRKRVEITIRLLVRKSARAN